VTATPAGPGPARPAPGSDPIAAAILQRRLHTIAEEMATAMLRSARSSIWAEAKDFMTAVYDGQGRTLEQVDYIPLITWGTQPCLEHIIGYFGDDLAAGDVILHNDVFTGSNQHADVGVYLPVFSGADLVGWVVAKGHVADIGGATLGGYNPAITEVWQEALRLPPVKVVDRGTLRRDVWDMIFANVRLDIVAEDVRGAIGACTIGARRLLRLIESEGITGYRERAAEIIAATERRLRAQLRRFPDGRASGVAYMSEGDGVSLARHRICVAVEIAGDELRFDFTGTDPQHPGYLNMPPASVRGAVLLSVLMLTDDLPRNAGLFAPITITLPGGSLVNPDFPAATVYGNQMVDHVYDAVMQALAQLLPDRATAGWCWELAGAWSGRRPDDGRPFVELGFFMEKGGGGAVRGTDGYDAIGFVGCAGTLAAQDPEVLELTGPTVLECYEYWTDSAGPGRWRGGSGIHTIFRLLGHDNVFTALGDGVAEEGAAPFWGLDGGRPGRPNTLTMALPGQEPRRLGSKELVAGLPPGTRFECYDGGGGGVGDPRDRPPERVAHDVREGHVSVAAARAEYGVVIDAGTLTVDAAATAALRARAGRPLICTAAAAAPGRGGTGEENHGDGNDPPLR
jgi:N-methylhydantoinase B